MYKHKTSKETNKNRIKLKKTKEKMVITNTSK